MDLIKNLVSTVIRAVFTYVYRQLAPKLCVLDTCAKVVHTGQMVLKAWCRFRKLLSWFGKYTVRTTYSFYLTSKLILFCCLTVLVCCAGGACWSFVQICHFLSYKLLLLGVIHGWNFYVFATHDNRGYYFAAQEQTLDITSWGQKTY